MFLGRLSQVAGAAEMQLDADGPLTLAEIAERLDPSLAVAIAAPEIRVALNGTLQPGGEVRAGNGDELAFLPPVSGG